MPQRRVSRSAVRRTILLLVEGEKTEEAYFSHWRRRCKETTLVTIDEFHGTPMSLVERAIRRKKDDARAAARAEGTAYDEIWCVFDVDEHPRLDEARQLATRYGVRIAASHPCIEIWFIWHFEDQTAHIERGPANARAKTLLRCEKALSLTALESLAAKHPAAVVRAKALEQRHAGNGSPPGTNPSSDVWRLTDSIESGGMAARTADAPDGFAGG
jgi:RloB-like protein